MPSSHRVHFFHLIWSTKERKNLIISSIESRLYAYIGGIIRKNEGTLLEIGGTTNHLHLLIELSNLDHFTALIRNVKSCSSAWIKKEYSEINNFAWQDGYASFSVSYSNINKTHEYIKNQKNIIKCNHLKRNILNFLTFIK